VIAVVSDPNDWLAALAALKARGEACVLVTLADIKGSAPRESGTKLVVTATSQSGSIGGGHLEHKATEIARGLLREDATEPRLETLPLGAALGQCCGGKVTLLFEPFHPVDFTIALFGAGHVGKALIGVLGGVPARVLWIDARDEQFPAEIPPNVTKVLADLPEDEVKDVPAGAYVLVMTHSHDLDLAICERFLKRSDCPYVGVIGSATKRRNFEGRLARKGFSEAQIKSLRCPIGLAGLEGKHPREIAIAVAAELLMLRDAARRECQAAPAPGKTASTA
jgi:xanthine dehydrogenase accessory factor